MAIERLARRSPQFLDHPFGLLSRMSLVLALSGGFGLGLYVLLGLVYRLPLSAGTPALIQAHGQVQTMGFVTLFIMAVGVLLIPRFHAATLDRPRLVSMGGVMLGIGVTVRAVAQPAEPTASRGIALILAALLELAGVLCAIYAFSRVIRSSVQPEPRGRRARLPVVLASSILGALVLNIAVSIRLALGASLVPLAQDEALVHLQLWGFASTMVLAVAGNIFPRFLLLRPTREQLMVPALGLWGLGSLGLPLAWLLAPEQPAFRMTAAIAQLGGAILYVTALRLYERPARPSGTPHVTNPTRTWTRVAFGFLILAAMLNVVLPARELGGDVSTNVMVSAARHALAQGFLLPVIVFMAARILPGYSGQMVRRSGLLAGMMWTLFAGAALRSVAELLGGYDPGWSTLVGLGGSLGVIAFTVFAIGLWRATGALPARL